MGKIGIIGATGTVGRELVSLFKEQHRDFCAFVRDPFRAAQKVGEDVKLVSFSYDHPDTYASALEGITSLFILFPTGVPDLASKVDNFLQTASKKGVQHVVAMTGMGADQYPNGWMAKMEKKIIEAKIPYTILRPNWFMQNFDNFFGRQICREETMTLPAGNAAVSFIDARDIAAVAAKVLEEKEHENRIYTLTGPELLTHEKIAEHLSESIGYRVQYIPQTDEEMIRRWQREGWPRPMIEEMLLLFQKIREGLFSTCSSDVEKILGRAPKSFREFSSSERHRWQKTRKSLIT